MNSLSLGTQHDFETTVMGERSLYVMLTWCGEGEWDENCHNFTTEQNVKPNYHRVPLPYELHGLRDGIFDTK